MASTLGKARGLLRTVAKIKHKSNTSPERNTNGLLPDEALCSNQNLNITRNFNRYEKYQKNHSELNKDKITRNPHDFEHYSSENKTNTVYSGQPHISKIEHLDLVRKIPKMILSVNTNAPQRVLQTVWVDSENVEKTISPSSGPIYEEGFRSSEERKGVFDCLESKSDQKNAESRDKLSKSLYTTSVKISEKEISPDELAQGVQKQQSTEVLFNSSSNGNEKLITEIRENNPTAFVNDEQIEKHKSTSKESPNGNKARISLFDKSNIYQSAFRTINSFTNLYSITSRQNDDKRLDCSDSFVEPRRNFSSKSDTSIQVPVYKGISRQNIKSQLATFFSDQYNLMCGDNAHDDRKRFSTERNYALALDSDWKKPIEMLKAKDTQTMENIHQKKVPKTDEVLICREAIPLNAKMSEMHLNVHDVRDAECYPKSRHESRNTTKQSHKNNANKHSLTNTYDGIECNDLRNPMKIDKHREEMSSLTENSLPLDTILKKDETNIATFSISINLENADGDVLHSIECKEVTPNLVIKQQKDDLMTIKGSNNEAKRKEIENEPFNNPIVTNEVLFNEINCQQFLEAVKASFNNRLILHGSRKKCDIPFYNCKNKIVFTNKIKTATKELSPVDIGCKIIKKKSSPHEESATGLSQPVSQNKQTAKCETEKASDKSDEIPTSPKEVSSNTSINNSILANNCTGTRDTPRNDATEDISNNIRDTQNNAEVKKGDKNKLMKITEDNDILDTWTSALNGKKPISKKGPRYNYFIKRPNRKVKLRSKTRTNFKKSKSIQLSGSFIKCLSRGNFASVSGVSKRKKAWAITEPSSCSVPAKYQRPFNLEGWLRKYVHFNGKAKKTKSRNSYKMSCYRQYGNSNITLKRSSYIKASSKSKGLSSEVNKKCTANEEKLSIEFVNRIDPYNNKQTVEIAASTIKPAQNIDNEQEASKADHSPRHYKLKNTKTLNKSQNSYPLVPSLSHVLSDVTNSKQLTSIGKKKETTSLDEPRFSRKVHSRSPLLVCDYFYTPNFPNIFTETLKDIKDTINTLGKEPADKHNTSQERDERKPKKMNSLKMYSKTNSLSKLSTVISKSTSKESITTKPSADLMNRANNFDFSNLGKRTQLVMDVAKKRTDEKTKVSSSQQTKYYNKYQTKLNTYNNSLEKFNTSTKKVKNPNFDFINILKKSEATPEQKVKSYKYNDVKNNYTKTRDSDDHVKRSDNYNNKLKSESNDTKERVQTSNVKDSSSSQDHQSKINFSSYVLDRFDNESVIYASSNFERPRSPYTEYIKNSIANDTTRYEARLPTSYIVKGEDSSIGLLKGDERQFPHIIDSNLKRSKIPVKGINKIKVLPSKRPEANLSLKRTLNHYDINSQDKSAEKYKHYQPINSLGGQKSKYMASNDSTILYSENSTYYKNRYLLSKED